MIPDVADQEKYLPDGRKAPCINDTENYQSSLSHVLSSLIHGGAMSSHRESTHSVRRRQKIKVTEGKPRRLRCLFKHKS